MSNHYENIALQGGGVWGSAYAGAFEELERLGVLSGIRRVAGTSAGSMAGLLLALRYTSAEINEILHTLNYAKFQDGGKVNQILRQYGYYKGNFASQLFRSWIYQKLGSEEATFNDLIAAGGLDLRVYAINLNAGQIHEFSQRKTGDVPLASAVRASISMPFFFTATEINQEIYVDGGAVFDYPLMGFGKDEIEQSLGLAFAQSAAVSSQVKKERAFGYRQPVQYIHRMMNVLASIQSSAFALHDELRQNTILIDTAGVKPYNFKLGKKEKERLIANGRSAVREFFAAADPAQD